jgi:amino acid permease
MKKVIRAFSLLFGFDYNIQEKSAISLLNGFIIISPIATMSFENKGPEMKDTPFDSDIERAQSNMQGDVKDVNTTTKRGLKSRHAQMIALGGTIGTGRSLPAIFQ